MPDLGALKQRLRDRWSFVDVLLAVVERTGAVGGGALASSIGLIGFLSLFPLLLVAIGVAGYVSRGDPTFARDVIERFGLRGDGARTVLDALRTAEQRPGTASLVGLAGLLWTGLGVVGALAAAVNAAWQVTGRGIVQKAWGLAWLLGAALLFATSMALSAVTNVLPWFLSPLSVAVALFVSVVLYTWTFTSVGNAPVSWREHVPGAIALALGAEVLKLLGTVWLPRTIGSSSSLYGSIGAVFALLAWFVLYGRLFVYAAVFNVVRHEREHGTVTVQMEAPRIPGEVPLQADRGGAVVEREAADA